MSKHTALIVEDERVMADHLAEILKSLEFTSTIVDNRRQALESIRSNTYCLVLLDLDIKNEPDSLRGSEAGGPSVLRKLRELYPERTGVLWRLPVVIVSALLSDAEVLTEIMRQGASHAIQKPIRPNTVVDRVRKVMAESGRTTHDLCVRFSANPPAAGERLLLSIPAEARGRGVQVVFGGRNVTLSEKPFRLLLRLVLAKLEGSTVPLEMGGYKGFSDLNKALTTASDSDGKLIENNYGGAYWLSDRVSIGPINAEQLMTSHDARVRDLVKAIVALLHPEAEV